MNYHSITIINYMALCGLSDDHEIEVEIDGDVAFETKATLTDPGSPDTVEDVHIWFYVDGKPKEITNIFSKKQIDEANERLVVRAYEMRRNGEL